MADESALSYSMSEATKILEAQGLPYYCKTNMLGDGNCFFHAIVDQLKDDEIRRTISVKKFKCPDCPLMFARKDTLDKHVKSAQANWRRHGVEFHCNICGKDFVFLSHSACSTHVFKKGDKLTCKTKEAER